MTTAQTRDVVPCSHRFAHKPSPGSGRWWALSPPMAGLYIRVYAWMVLEWDPAQSDANLRERDFDFAFAANGLPGGHPGGSGSTQ